MHTFCDWFSSMVDSIIKLYPSPYFRFKYIVVPTHCNSPEEIIAKRSLSKSASSRWWVDRTIVRPGLYLSIRSQIARRANGSTPDENESRVFY